jgi:Glycogen recognition site of AMP-activated protein kinase
MGPTLSPELLEFNKPGASPTTTTTKISVRFVPLSPLHLQIKTRPMNTSPANNDTALHRLAAHIESFSLPPTGQITANRLPATSEKTGATKNGHIFHFAAHRPPPATKIVSLPKRTFHHVFENPLDGLRNTEFRMEAPSAKNVQLAGDFTNWEQSPLDMVQSYDGTWFTIVPLLPGTYTYRFIVDGQWLDDPSCHCHEPNPFGSANAVVNVD